MYSFTTYLRLTTRLMVLNPPPYRPASSTSRTTTHSHPLYLRTIPTLQLTPPPAHLTYSDPTVKHKTERDTANYTKHKPPHILTTPTTNLPTQNQLPRPEATRGLTFYLYPLCPVTEGNSDTDSRRRRGSQGVEVGPHLY